MCGLASAAKPFLKFVLQSGHHNPRWPPNWPLKYIKSLVFPIKGVLPKYGTNDTHIPGKDIEDIWNAIRTPLSRHTALSHIVSCAMERPLPLDISGAASRNDAYADVVSCVHRDADEGIICRYAAHCSLRRSRRHHHMQVVDRACRLSTTVLLLDFFQSGTKTYQELSEYTWRLWVECQSHSPSLAVTAYTEIQRLPTPAGQPRCDEPHFFAAGHMNYACYMTWYLRNVENLPTAANNDLTKGAHVYCDFGEFYS